MPSLLSARQSYQWIQRVNQKFKELEALKLSPAQKMSMKAWLEIEFVAAALAFEGLSVSRQQIAEVVAANSASANPVSSNQSLKQTNASSIEESATQQAITETLAALRIVEDLGQRVGRSATLDLSLLARLHQPTNDCRATSANQFRQSSSTTSAIKAEHLPFILESACNWFAMASFAELNPVEQAAIAFLRLLEIVPFERDNQRTSLIAASLFLLRSELPPIIIKPEQREAYLAALQEGLHMNTQPMVNLLAENVEHTLTDIIKVASA